MAQQRKQQQQAQASLSSTAAAAAAAAGGNVGLLEEAGIMSGSEYAGSGAFVVEPSECVVPAGQQQKFTVRFSSWQVGTHSVNLVGRQYFVQQHDDASNSSSGSGGLTVTLWPRQQEQQQQQQQQGAAGAGGPLELIVSGGFHAAAAPPPAPMPPLQLSLSASTVPAQLTPEDPSCLQWTCCSTHAPGSHASFRHCITLVNTAGCPLAFQLRVEGPFVLAAAVPSVVQDPVAFSFLLLVVHAAHRLPLAATVLHPAVTAAPASLDFGLVHPAAPRPLQLLLTNPSRVDAAWQAQLVSLPAAAAAGGAAGLTRFAVEPAAGVIPGRGLGMPRSQRITVTCVAAGNGPGAAELRLSVAHGAGCSVRLQGCGTFDEAQEYLAVLMDM
ncbi:hypothetical protein OEZ85_002608 [Tetradesmus obliquus]|uniref:Uncharacterized protein n=1 Tax=Tetradesmus obliquus TaxID=3088 RepID=A0ABY8TY48_TETOB|nr:hypothetical protein OEZ85_002608 [Tetradesmus obliquus]